MPTKRKCLGKRGRTKGNTLLNISTSPSPQKTCLGFWKEDLANFEAKIPDGTPFANIYCIEKEYTFPAIPLAEHERKVKELEKKIKDLETAAVFVITEQKRTMIPKADLQQAIKELEDNNEAFEETGAWNKFWLKGRKEILRELKKRLHLQERGAGKVDEG